jgi:threonine/homoserine/homoserine lactone efflux protein
MIFFLSNIFFAFLAAISPGPNIVLVTSNSLAYGKRVGFTSAFGVLAGVAIWFVFLSVGFSYILDNPKIVMGFHCFAALYLLYIAYHIDKLKISFSEEEVHSESRGKFFLESFVSTILNAEIAIFYGAILTGILSHYDQNRIYWMILYLLGFMIVETVVFTMAVIASLAVRHFIYSYLKIIKLLAASAMIYYSITLMLKAYDSLYLFS